MTEQGYIKIVSLGWRWRGWFVQALEKSRFCFPNLGKDGAISQLAAKSERNTMKRYSLMLGILLLCWQARAVSVEAGYMRGDFPANDMALYYGPDKIIESLRFYLADKTWKGTFPPVDGYNTAISGSVFRAKSKGNSLAKVEAAYTITPDGLKYDLTAHIHPHSGVHYAACDLLLNKAVFTNAVVQANGAGKIVLNPAKWKAIRVDQAVLATSLGDWRFTVTSGDHVPWVLRSVCDRKFGPEEKRTFSFLNQVTGVPATGMTVRLSVEAKFAPKADYQQQISRQCDEQASSYLSALLTRYGITSVKSDLPKESAQHVAWLAAKVASTSANLKENRLDPQAGTVIPTPKSYQRGTGVFRVPAKLTLLCTPDHSAALEVLTEDLSRFGVKIARTDPPAQPSGWAAIRSFFHLAKQPAPTSTTPTLLMGVPARDAFIKKACAELKLTVDTPPEGYVLAVTSNSVLIAGHDDAGVLYGAQTLRQLIRKGGSGAEIPSVTIKDYPDLKFRGFYVEGAGRNANTEDLRRLIRNTYSYFKANAVVLQVHWPEFKWQSHPELASDKALPIADLAAIADYARKFHLEVIPAVFTYGKVGNLIAKHPEIAEVPEVAAKQKNQKDLASCPNKPASYALIFDLLNEILAATHCRRLHIGHDEIKGMALCPMCQAIPPADLFANDVNKIAGWLADHRVETMLWGDFLLDNKTWVPLGVHSANSCRTLYGNLNVAPAIDKIRKDVIITDWHYYGSNSMSPVAFPTLKYFADKGFRVIGCPWHNTWNNYHITEDVRAINQMGVLTTDWGFLNVWAPGANSMVGVACAWNTAMPEPDRLPWSPEAVLAASLLKEDRPSRFTGATFTSVDLAAAANRLLAGTDNAWFGSGRRHGLIAPPQGTHRLFGVEYKIGKNCVLVGVTTEAQGLSASSSKIPVHMPVKSLIFLQALEMDTPSVTNQKYGQYRVTYASGQTADIAIDNRNITHWLSQTPRQNPWRSWIYGYTWDALLAWEGCTTSGEPVNLQAYEWVNPHPADPVVSVELRAQQKIPGLKLGLVALTAVR